MDPTEIKRLTPHGDVNHVLLLLTEGLRVILGRQLTGLYLTGSLTYGGFEDASSDIDFLAVLDRSLQVNQRVQVESLHERIARAEPKWAMRIECSYITREMLGELAPPTKPRPYVNYGKMWKPDPTYGNEWLLNLSAVRERGVALTGPHPKDLIQQIDDSLLREASMRDLLQQWEPKLRDPSLVATPGARAYAVLTMCRALYRARNGGASTKRAAAAWVMQAFGDRWHDLVTRATTWQQGQDFSSAVETADFIRFTIGEAGRNSLAGA